MDPNPEVYYMSEESANKRNLIIDSVMYFRFFYFFWSFLAILSIGGAFGGAE